MIKFSLFERIKYKLRKKIKLYIASRRLPKTIRIDGSSICQLRCLGCGFQKSNGREIGLGYLTFEHFKNFIDNNSQIERIELSNYGEIFLNPDLIRILSYAYEKDVKLEASMGVNFNTVSDEQIRALVDYEFRYLSFSIDGASQETYSQYRIGGNFDQVITNIRKLINYKKERGTNYPKLQWQFVLNEFDENEVLNAKAMADELEIPIFFKLNFMSNYKPKDPIRLKEETGLTELTREEYLEKYKLPYLNDDCMQIFNDPQFNYDGRLLGCCRNERAYFESNLFSDGLNRCMKDPKLQKMREFLLSKNPDPNRYKGLPCVKCALWIGRNKYNKSM